VHVLAAKAVALREAGTAGFRSYAARVVENARALAAACLAEGLDVVTGGTDNHLLLVDVARAFNLTGRQAESSLRDCGITLNRNALPFDTNGPWYTSGLRLGTPAVTTRGFGPDEMKVIASLIARVVSGTTAEPNSRAKYRVAADLTEEVRAGVRALTEAFPLYPELPADL